MAGTTLAPRLPRFDAQPRARTCGCGATVLHVHLDVPLIIDSTESASRFLCSECLRIKRRGQSRPVCHICGGTGRIGAGLPETGVALDERDRARYWRAGDPVRRGEAVYRLHEHSSSTALAA